MYRATRRGISLVELLIALAISATLLTATAAAVDAAFKAYAINQEQAALMQSARVAIERIVSTIRRTEVHAPEDAAARTSFASGTTVTVTAAALLDDTNNDGTTDVETIFRYDAPSKRLLAVVGGKSYTLAQGVEAFSMKMEPMRSAKSQRTGGSWDLLRRATVQLTLRTPDGTGKQTVTLCATAAPRRNSW